MIVDQIEQFWNSLLEFSGTFVTPDWGALVGLLPVFVLLLIVGPIVTILAIAWVVYGVRKPRAKVGYLAPHRHAELDSDGRPIFPPGEPYSPGERVIYGPGDTRSASGEDLLVACPKCGLVRQAAVATCGNCGLSFKLRTPTRSARTAGPPPGGAAAA